MLPNQAPPPSPMQPRPGVASPMSPGAAGDDGVPKDAIKQQLKMLLSQAKKIADSNGINFSDIVAEISGNVTRSDAPRPPSPPVGGPMMGG